MDWSTFTYSASKKIGKYQYRVNVHKNIARLKFSKFFNPSSIHITCTGATDGGCAQLLRQLSTIAFTKSFGFSYIHSPLSAVEHNINNDAEWTDKWEDFFNLSNFSDTKKDPKTEFKVYKNLNELIWALMKCKHEKKPKYYQILDCYSYTNLHPATFLSIKESLRRSYFQNKRLKNLLYDKNALNVAIHVRRGDVSKDGTPERFTSLQKLKQTIHRIEYVLGSNDYKITLFCIQEYQDLKDLESKNVRLIHKLDIFDVLDHLIHSDVLVTSKSSVGYISAIISNGVIIYEPFWHPPLQGWLTMERNFQQDLKNKLTEMYPKKFNLYSSRL